MGEYILSSTVEIIKRKQEQQEQQEQLEIMSALLRRLSGTIPMAILKGNQKEELPIACFKDKTGNISTVYRGNVFAEGWSIRRVI